MGSVFHAALSPTFPAATYERSLNNADGRPDLSLSLSTPSMFTGQPTGSSEGTHTHTHTHTHTQAHTHAHDCMHMHTVTHALGQLGVRSQHTASALCSLWRRGGGLPQRMASQFYKLFIRPPRRVTSIWPSVKQSSGYKIIISPKQASQSNRARAGGTRALSVFELDH